MHGSAATGTARTRLRPSVCSNNHTNNIIPKATSRSVAAIVIIVIGAIIASMLIAGYMYVEYTPDYLEVAAGEPVMVGPVEYTVSFESTHMGDKEEKPEHVFVMIALTAENKGEDRTLLSGGQFYIEEEDGARHQAVYGNFSQKDLLVEWLEPGDIVERSTQFDIPFDEDASYNILIRPQKEQEFKDVGAVCITNCQV